MIEAGPAGTPARRAVARRRSSCGSPTPTPSLRDKGLTMRLESTTRLAVADDKPPADQAALDKAFDALTTFDWGTDRNALKPIDEAVVATRGDAAAHKALETRLAAVLKTTAPRAAKDFVCRKLTVIGTAESAPALAALLTDK